MHDRAKFWWQALRQGTGELNGAAGWLALIVLVLGVVAGITVPLVFHLSRWLTATILLGLFVVVALEGSYRVWAATETAHKAALTDTASKPSAPIHTPVFWQVNGGTVAENEIHDTYNASVPTTPGPGMPGSTLSGQASDFPALRPSTLEERTDLRTQLLTLANKVEMVMAPWAQMREVVAAQMGIPPEEFLARMQEILAERDRMDGEATDRYNRECRSAVIEVYGHVRSIGFADGEMERYWRTRFGAGAEGMPNRLQRIAAQVEAAG